MNVQSIMLMTATIAQGKPVAGRGEAAVWYPDGDMAAEVHGNLGTMPDPIDPLDMAQMFAAAPAMYAKLASWLERLAKRSEETVTSCRFESLNRAYRADARNYAATAKDIRDLLAEVGIKEVDSSPSL